MQIIKSGKRDLYLILILALIGIGLLVIFLGIKPSGSRVKVFVDGTEVGEYSLAVDGRFVIEGADGGTNVLVIEDGHAYMDEASCPDHLCMNMGQISKGGQSIICLPNKVVVEVASDNKSEIDAVAQ